MPIILKLLIILFVKPVSIKIAPDLLDINWNIGKKMDKPPISKNVLISDKVNNK